MSIRFTNVFLPLNMRIGLKFELQNKNNIIGLQDLERRGGAGLVHLLERQGQDGNLRRRLFSHKREQEQQHFQGRRRQRHRPPPLPVPAQAEDVRAQVTGVG